MIVRVRLSGPRVGAPAQDAARAAAAPGSLAPAAAPAPPAAAPACPRLPLFSTLIDNLLFDWSAYPVSKILQLSMFYLQHAPKYADTSVTEGFNCQVNKTI